MVAATATPLEFVRRQCPTCRGHLRDAYTPSCRECGAFWTAASFDLWIETYDRGIVYDLLHGWRWIAPRWLTWFLPHGREGYRWDVALPCGHPFTALCSAEGAVCWTCRGVGTVASLELSRAFRSRVAPPIPQWSYRPARYPAVAPMHTPLLAETTRKSLSLFDWQRSRNWPSVK